MAEPNTASLDLAVRSAGATDKPGRRSMFVSVGAVLSAFLASLCCIGPILFSYARRWSGPRKSL